jgi:hypothetical protein
LINGPPERILPKHQILDVASHGGVIIGSGYTDRKFT